MWRATMPQYMISLPEGQAPSSFCIDTCAWLLDPLVIAAGYNSSVNLVRTPPKMLDGHDNIVLLVVCEGSWQGDTEGRPFHLEAGEMIALDTSKNSSGLVKDAHYVTLNAPRRTIAELMPSVSALHGHLFRSATGRLLADHLIALSRYLPAMQRSEAARATQATMTLIAAGLGEVAAQFGYDDTFVSPAIRRRGERYIERNLSRTDLTPSRISEELEIPRSTLYRAFTPLGGVSAYILERRLETARAILFHPEDHRPINEIADAIGFENAATFSKAFSRRFGCSPREARSNGSTRVEMSGRSLFEFWHNVLKARENPQGPPPGTAAAAAQA
jgi:AraC-like DNA-binding protein